MAQRKTARTVRINHDIIQALKIQPGMSLGQIADKICLAPERVAYRMKLLVADGLVKAVGYPGHYIYFAAEDEIIASDNIERILPIRRKFVPQSEWEK